MNCGDYGFDSDSGTPMALGTPLPCEDMHLCECCHRYEGNKHIWFITVLFGSHKEHFFFSEM